MKIIIQYIILFCAVMILTNGLVIAQNIYSTKSRKAIKLYEESEHYMMRKQYIHVLNMLNDALKRDKKFTEAHLRLA